MTAGLPPRGTALFALHGVSAGHDGRAVIADVSLTIHAGECWCVLGPNGAGKSTLVATLLGLIAPLAGRIDRHAAVGDRSGVGFVPQRCDLAAHVVTTVREFVDTGTIGIALRQRERRARVAATLATVALTGMERTSFAALSGGQRQRALLARALVRAPLVLVVDEPTTGLDPAAQEALSAVLADRYRRDGITVIAVTHDLGLAARVATHVAFVHRGRVETGATADVLTPALLHEVFGVRARLERGAEA